MKTESPKSVNQLHMGGPIGMSITWVCVNNKQPLNPTIKKVVT